MQEKVVMAAEAEAAPRARGDKITENKSWRELFHNCFSVFEKIRHPEKHPHVDEREVYCTVCTKVTVTKPKSVKSVTKLWPKAVVATCWSKGVEQQNRKSGAMLRH